MNQGETDNVERFWEQIEGEAKLFGKFVLKKYTVKDDEEGGIDHEVKPFLPKLYRVIPVSKGANANFKLVRIADPEKKQIPKGLLTPDSVFILDDGFKIFCWVGSDANATDGGKEAFHYGMIFLKKLKRPRCLPIKKGHARKRTWDIF